VNVALAFRRRYFPEECEPLEADLLTAADEAFAAIEDPAPGTCPASELLREGDRP
jgi:hypothetical protein